MIRSFRNKDTEALFHDVIVPRFRAIERSARRKLLYLHRARMLRGICRRHQETVWRPWQETGGASTASASTINGGSVSGGKTTGRTRWRFWTITEGDPA